MLTHLIQINKYFLKKKKINLKFDKYLKKILFILKIT